MLNDEQREKIRQLSRGPWDARYIAGELGLSTAQVRREQKRANLSASSDTKFPAALIGKVIELAIRKISVREIATRLDIRPWKAASIVQQFLPVDRRQREGRRGVKLTEATKLAVRRAHRQALSKISEEMCISLVSLRKTLRLGRYR
jgi:hypothetical protein